MLLGLSNKKYNLYVYALMCTHFFPAVRKILGLYALFTRCIQLYQNFKLLTFKKHGFDTICIRPFLHKRINKVDTKK